MKRLLHPATLALSLFFQTAIAQTPAPTAAPRGGGQTKKAATPPPIEAKPEELVKIKAKTAQLKRW